jgi:hypothetical protein
MSQGAPSEDISDEQRLALVQMFATLQVHRRILQEIRGNLDPMNFRNISNIEVQEYQKRVNDAKMYVVDPANKLNIVKFVKAIQNFKEIGEAIIIIFNDALDLWELFHVTGISKSEFRDGKNVYQKCLLECRTKIDELLAEFREF